MKRSVKIPLIILSVLLVIAGGLLILIEHNIRPILLSMAEARVRAIAVDAINKAVAVTFRDVRYQDLIEITYDRNMQVTHLGADAVLMNSLATSCALTAQQYIADIDMQPIRVSLGSATGIQLLSGRGPSVLVRVEPAGSVTSQFYSRFNTSGINQTHHRIFMQISAVVRIIIPTGSAPMEVSAQVPIAETVIVGQVPQSFVNVTDTDDMLNLIPDPQLPLEITN